MTHCVVTTVPRSGSAGRWPIGLRASPLIWPTAGTQVVDKAPLVPDGGPERVAGQARAGRRGPYRAVAGRFWEDLRARGSYLVKATSVEPLLGYLRSIGVLPQQWAGGPASTAWRPAAGLRAVSPRRAPGQRGDDHPVPEVREPSSWRLWAIRRAGRRPVPAWRPWMARRYWTPCRARPPVTGCPRSARY